MHTNTPFSALIIGARFVTASAPHVVKTKVSHTWAAIDWKGVHTEFPMHPADHVTHAPADLTNP